MLLVPRRSGFRRDGGSSVEGPRPHGRSNDVIGYPAYWRAMNSGTVIFNHGLHSGPWGTKIRSLAAVARVLGFEVSSVDCTGVEDPRVRVGRLEREAERAMAPLVLAGSSLGAWVAAAASTRLQPALLFLVAPAVHLPGLPDPAPAPVAGRVVVVHGWRDEVVPVDNALRYARHHGAETHVFDADHRLIDVLPRIGQILEAELRRVGAE